MIDDPRCKQSAGVIRPVIDPERCEAKGACVQACPYDVLALHPVTQEVKRNLSLMGRVRLWAHGGQQAYAVDPESCHGCGICVAVCPEKAITLARVTGN